MNVYKQTIFEEISNLEDLRQLHDGEQTFFAEAVVFAGMDESAGIGARVSVMTIKDTDGRRLTIVLPRSFVEQLTACGIKHIINRKPAAKSGHDLKEFSRLYRKCFDHDATDEFIETIYFCRELPVSFIASNGYLPDLTPGNGGL